MTLRSVPAAAVTLAAALLISSSITIEVGANETETATSSDGLVYVVADEQGMDLWRARISDGALQRLTNTNDQEERRPSWSDAANRLLMIVRNTEGTMHSTIKLLDIQTGQVSGLGPDPDVLQRFPVWSPDGKSVAHSFRLPASGTNSGTHQGVAVVRVGAKQREVISKVEEIKHRMMQLDYSNSGHLIVARGRNPTTKNVDGLYVLRPRTKPLKLHQIAPGLYTKPQFTRDDQSVVFTYRPRVGRPRDIMALSLETNSIAKRVANMVRADDHSASPSPTRDEIVFVSDRDRSHDIFLANLAGGLPVNLTKGSKLADTSPVWSPDGERIAYVAMSPEDFESDEKNLSNRIVRVIDREGKLLFETEGTMPGWMPPWVGDQPLAKGAEAQPEVVDKVLSEEQKKLEAHKHRKEMLRKLKQERKSQQ